MIDTELHRVAEKPAPATDDELLALCDKASPAPWSACHEGRCSCKQVWTADYPVAKVEAGEWGDFYPAVRVTDSGEGLHGTKMIVEAFMDGIPYGEISEEGAEANAQLIAEARAAIPRLIEEKRELQRAQRSPLQILTDAMVRYRAVEPGAGARTTTVLELMGFLLAPPHAD